MLIEINEIDVKEFLIWANSRSFCNSGQHVCDRITTIFEGIPAEDRYDREPEKPICGNCENFKLVSKGGSKSSLNCAIVGYSTRAENNPCDRFKPKSKPLVQYLDEYIEHELESDTDIHIWSQLIEQALDAYQSTENVTIKIERNVT